MIDYMSIQVAKLHQNLHGENITQLLHPSVASRREGLDNSNHFFAYLSMSLERQAFIRGIEVSRMVFL